MDRAITRKQTVFFISTVLAGFAVFLDFSMISTILAFIQGDLNSTFALQLVMTANIIMLGCFLVLMGRLGDRFGKKKFFVAGIGIFVIGSIGIAMSYSSTGIVIFRGVQGLGNALMISSSLSIIYSIFQKDKRMHMTIIWSGLSSLGLIIGPIVGGIYVNYVDWRWALSADVFVALVCLILFFLSHKGFAEEKSKEKIDWSGFFLLVIFLFSVTSAIVLGPVWGWHFFVIHLLIIIGLISFFLLCQVEIKKKNAIIPFHFFPNWIFVGSFIGNFMLFFLVCSEFFFLPLFLQNMTQLPPYVVGLLVSPLALGVLIFSPNVGKFVKRSNMKAIVLIGFALFAVTAAVQLIDHDFNYVLAAIFFCAIAWGLTFIPLQRTSFYTLPEKFSKMILEGFFTINAIGGTIGVALSGAVFRLGEMRLISKLLAQNHLSLTNVETHMVRRSLFNLERAQSILDYFTGGGGKKFIFIFQKGFLEGFDWVNWVLLTVSIIAFLSISVLYFLRRSAFNKQ